MVKLFTLVGLVRGGLVNVSSHEKQILFQKLGANNHFVFLKQAWQDDNRHFKLAWELLEF